jgi:plastocyanin
MKPGINLTLGALLMLVVFGISSVALFGGAQLVDEEEAAAEDGGEDGSVPGGPVNVTVVARNLQFERRSITASPGAQVTVTLNNQDAGVLHNIAFYTNRSASTSIAVGELFPGVASRDLQFMAPNRAGNYFYRCDVHPDTMTGSFAVRVQ